MSLRSNSVSAFEWNSIEETGHLVERLSAELGRNAMHREGRTFREAWIAHRFAVAREATSVRLLRETDAATPDFSLRISGVERVYESTEVDDPARRRGDEYRKPEAEQPYLYSYPDFQTVAETTRMSVAKKAGKQYANCWGLVIRLNCWPFELRANHWQALIEASRSGIEKFQEVWLMTDEVFPLWIALQAQALPNQK